MGAIAGMARSYGRTPAHSHKRLPLLLHPRVRATLVR